MGRKKIAITRIADERNRQITFSKRKAGLLKKAYELSILCDCEIAVIMITNNRKLYQYASSNMNSILIRYTEFKDPDESKTNADILEDIQRKERGPQHGDESGEEEDPATSMQSSFMLTPQTQAQYGKMNEEFDHMLQRNQILLPDQLPGNSGGGGGSGGAQGRGPPRVMPVTVPVAPSPGAVTQQIQQHLAQQMEMRVGTPVTVNSANSASSSGTMSSLISPQSDLSASPASAKSFKSPSMPPPLSTPARLQTLRNHSLKLHLPGGGRNYISLAGSSPGGKKGSAGNGGGGRDGGEGDGEGGGGGTTGSKPHLRVMIPGQKGFVPRTQAISPLPQMELTTAASGAKDTATTTSTGSTRREKDGAVKQTTQATANTTASNTTSHSESLTTPVLSLATPNLLSSLPPPLFSGLTGEFPFSALMSGGIGGMGGGGGGGGGGELSSALVAFPVSIQPSSSTGPNSGAGNIVLQAQNMGQPFLLTPNIDPRQNPMLSQQTFTPPPSSMSPNMRDLEQLKHQYERVQQQLLQQQLFISQQLHHQQQQQQQTPNKDGAPSVTMKPAGPPKDNATPRRETSGTSTKEGRSRATTAVAAASSLKDSQEYMDTGESTPTKRARLDSSPGQPTSV